MGLFSVLAPAAIGAAASFIGGERRNQSQQNMSAKQMAFQKEMSNTAHQRQMADLKAAGINPILAASYGGASSPGGSMAQIQDTITPAVNTGLQSMQTTETTNVLQKQADQIVELTALNKTEEALAMAKRALTSLEYNEKLLQMEIIEEQMKMAIRQGGIAASEAGRILAWIKEARESIIGGTSVSPFNFNKPGMR